MQDFAWKSIYLPVQVQGKFWCIMTKIQKGLEKKGPVVLISIISYQIDTNYFLYYFNFF